MVCKILFYPIIIGIFAQEKDNTFIFCHNGFIIFETSEDNKTYKVLFSFWERFLFYKSIEFCYNYENSEIYQYSNYLEKLSDKELEKYYIYYDKVNKSINYKEQYEKNIYKEEAFTDPDYLEKNSSEIPEKDKNFSQNLF